MKFFRIFYRVITQTAHSHRLAVGLGLANIVVAGLQFVDPLLFGRVIALLARSGEMAQGELWSQAARLIGIWAIVGGISIASNMTTALQAERMAHRNRLNAMSRFFTHVLSLPLSFHGDMHSGKLMKTMFGGADAVFAFWLVFFRDQLTTFVATAVLLPLTMILNWRLALSLMVLVVVFSILAFLVIQKTEAGQRRAQIYQAALAGTAQDALANVMVVQSFTRISDETHRFGETVKQVIAHQFPVLNWWAVVNVLTRGSSTVAVISMVLIGTVLHIQGKAGVGEIVSFMGIAVLLIGRLESAMNFAAQMFLQVPPLEDYFGVLDSRSSVPEKAGAPALKVARGEVVFEDVRFAYPGGPAILNDISFVARPGTSVALVGHTGAGKSTSMALLQRMWDPTGGRIIIDGQDLRDVSLDSLRRSIGMVFQESLLFNRSIRENLRIGNPGASEEDIERACRQADAHEFIIRQPQGYDTMVGERGATLSGGQRQRLSIARALLKNPPILILDEATSALDAATEARVSRAMTTLMQGRTTFIIAHRLSTVRDADEILVFDGGEIVERGRFEELLAQRGRFAELVATQLSPSLPPQLIPQLAAAD